MGREQRGGEQQGAFKALRIHEVPGGVEPRVEQLTLDELSPGDVVIRAEYSSINFKDALAATGKGRILRRFPLIGGVDVAGRVLASGDPRWQPRDPVVVVGCGLGESHDGGFSQVVRVPGDWVTRLPDGLDTRRAMAIGTAGFTAALAIDRLERLGHTPDLGPMAVTGATGGVGSMAITMLAGLGYRVVALTGKATADPYLRAIGAHEIRSLQGLTLGTKPLEKAIWGGAIDSLGGPVLAWLTRTTVGWGSIASIGLAQSPELSTTVMPFILRGVSLLGINSVDVPRDVRLEVWRRLAGDLKPAHLDQIAGREVDLDQLPAAFGSWMDGTVTGRCVVRLT